MITGDSSGQPRQRPFLRNERHGSLHGRAPANTKD